MICDLHWLLLFPPPLHRCSPFDTVPFPILACPCTGTASFLLLRFLFLHPSLFAFCYFLSLTSA
uniref:Uncharacterized protein n=1 Tax=Oryzias latipes TaxID=8090 RepID=A0A3P9KPR3_ORYLA